LLAQEKVTKEKGTPVAAPRENHARCPALLANTEREPNSPADEKHTRSGSNIVSRIPSASALVLGLLYGEEQQQLQKKPRLQFLFAHVLRAVVNIQAGQFRD
jgi:hypothetical protein